MIFSMSMSQKKDKTLYYHRQYMLQKWSNNTSQTLGQCDPTHRRWHHTNAEKIKERIEAAYNQPNLGQQGFIAVEANILNELQCQPKTSTKTKKRWMSSLTFITIRISVFDTNQLNQISQQCQTPIGQFVESTSGSIIKWHKACIDWESSQQTSLSLFHHVKQR